MESKGQEKGTDRKRRRDVKVENSFHDCPWVLSIFSIQVPNTI
jgi:hypothetical protein